VLLIITKALYLYSYFGNKGLFDLILRVFFSAGGSNAGYWTIINFQLSSKQCEEKG